MRKTRNINLVYAAYIDRIRKIDIVRKVLLSRTNATSIVWTIIEAEPFNDSLRMPIYSIQCEVLKRLNESIRLDFRMLNLLELPESTDVESILPQNANILWQRT